MGFLLRGRRPSLRIFLFFSCASLRICWGKWCWVWFVFGFLFCFLFGIKWVFYFLRILFFIGGRLFLPFLLPSYPFKNHLLNTFFINGIYRYYRLSSSRLGRDFLAHNSILFLPSCSPPFPRCAISCHLRSGFCFFGSGFVIHTQLSFFYLLAGCCDF